MSQSYMHRQMTAAEQKSPALILLKPYRQFSPTEVLTEVTGLLRDQLLNPRFGYARLVTDEDLIVNGRFVGKKSARQPDPTPVQAAPPPKVVQQQPQPKLTMPDRTKST